MDSNAERFVGLSLGGYDVFYACLIVVMFVSKRVLERKRRVAFNAAYDPVDLLINRYNPNVVYHVLENVGAVIKAVTVWRGKYPEKNGDKIVAEATHFVPCEEADFISPKS